MKGGVISQMINGAAVIYQQGGSNGPRQRTNLSDALALANEIGAGVVLVDGSLGQPTTEAIAYDWDNVAVGLALWTGGAFTLDVVEGTTFTNLERIINTLYINNKATSTPVMTIDGNLELHLVEASAIQTDAAGTAPFFRITSGANFILYIEDYGFMDGNSAHAVLEAQSGAGVSIGLGAGARIPDNTLTGAGSIQVTRGVTVGATPYYYADVSSTQTGASALVLIPA